MPLRRLLLLAVLSLLSVAAPASAVQVERIAQGLDNPRHLDFGGDDLYVAEAGRGGAGPCFGAPEGRSCVGATGAVTVIDRQGRQRRLIRGLASFAAPGSGAGAIGPHGILVKGQNNQVFLTNGGPTSANRDQLARQNPVANLFGRVLRVKPDGGLARVADVWGFERDHNPDGDVGNPEIDSNAVDVLSDNGRLVIADAGGNTLLKQRVTGALRVLSVFPNRSVQFGGGPFPMQAVPTGVVKAPNGDYFMSQLTGFPFPRGAARVYRVAPRSGNATLFAGGFTNIMDLAVDRNGTVWVLEIDHDSLFGPVGPSTDGAIFSVDPNRTRRRLQLPPGTLTHPGGITVGKDGDLYVTNKADVAGQGEVLRIDVDD